MRRVEFHTLLQGGTQRGHGVYISTAPGQSALLGHMGERILLRVDVNGIIFDAEGWPSGLGNHLIPIPEEVVERAHLHGGDSARVALHIMGS